MTVRRCQTGQKSQRKANFFPVFFLFLSCAGALEIEEEEVEEFDCKRVKQSVVFELRQTIKIPTGSRRHVWQPCGAI